MSGQPGETQVLLITCNNYHLLIPVGHIPAPHETSSEQSKSASDAGNTSQDTNAKKPNGLESVKSENGSYLVSPSYQNGTAALGVFNTSDQEDCVGKLCTSCGQLFKPKNISEWKAHLRSHTGQNSYKKSNIGDLQLRSWKSSGQQNCRVGRKKKPECHIAGCGWSFDSKYKLERHLRGHSGEKPFICSVENCKRTFSTSYNLKAHSKVHEDRILCPFQSCKETFRSQRKLDIHKRTSHPKGSYSCRFESCGKEFESSEELRIHRKSHHGSYQFVCSVPGCDKRYPKQSALEIHARTHSGEKPFKCSYEGCTWAFSTSSKLNRHEKIHVGIRPYGCGYEGCNKTFTRASHLEAHLSSHRGEKPFSCSFEGCRAKFTAASSLKAHMFTHSGEKPHKCLFSECHKAFVAKASLQKHLRRHEKKAKCQAQEKLARNDDKDALQNSSDGQTQKMQQKGHESISPSFPTESSTILPDAGSALDFPLFPTPGINEIEVGLDDDVIRQNAIVALGEAACAQYMSSSDIEPPIDLSTVELSSLGDIENISTDFSSGLLAQELIIGDENPSLNSSERQNILEAVGLLSDENKCVGLPTSVDKVSIPNGPTNSIDDSGLVSSVLEVKTLFKRSGSATYSVSMHNSNNSSTPLDPDFQRLADNDRFVTGFMETDISTDNLDLNDISDIASGASIIDHMYSHHSVQGSGCMNMTTEAEQDSDSVSYGGSTINLQDIQ